MASSRLPVMCPACDQQAKLQGTHVDSIMIRDAPKSLNASQDAALIVRCELAGHRFEYAKLLALKPRMVKLTLQEKQPGNTMTMQVWIYPEVLEALKQRYPQNLNTTLCSFLTALADPDSLFIEGEQARALHEAGVLRGRDIGGLAEQFIRQGRELRAAKVREAALGPMFQQMMQGMMGAQAGGAGGGGMIPGMFPGAPMQASAASTPVEPALPPRRDSLPSNQSSPSSDLSDIPFSTLQTEPAEEFTQEDYDAIMAEMQEDQPVLEKVSSLPRYVMPTGGHGGIKPQE